MPQQDENLKARFKGLFDDGANGVPDGDPGLKLPEHDLVIEKAILEILDAKNGEEKAAVVDRVAAPAEAARRPAAELDIAILFPPDGTGEPALPSPTPAAIPTPAGEAPRVAPQEERIAAFPRALAGLIVVGTVGFVALAAMLALQPGRWIGYILYWAAYAALLVFAVLRLWRSNRALTRALREAEQKYDQAREAQRLAAEVEQRNRALEETVTGLQRRILRMQAAGQVIGALSSAATDPDDVARRAVEAIQQQFGLYYVGFYLLDESGEWAVLKGGTGDAGRQRLSQGHKVRVRGGGGDSPITPGWSRVGRCIAENQASLAVDEGKITLLLPDTRSEVALPLRGRGPTTAAGVIGALELHSDAPDAFSQDDLPLLQVMADQIAAAVENARLLAAARAEQEGAEEARRRRLHEQWNRFAQIAGTPVYERVRTGAPSLDGGLPSRIERVIAQRERVVQSNTDNGTEAAALVIPISLRDEPLGALGLIETKDRRQWTEDEIALIEAVADQMALAIENARLLEETRQRAEQERIIAEITARVRASTQVDAILRTAVRELGRTLRASEGAIQLVVGEETVGAAAGGVIGKEQEI